MTSSFLEAARDAFRRGSLPEAERQLRSLLRTEPRHPQALHLLGLIAHRRGETRAIELLEAACAIEPENGEMRAHLAEVQRAHGDPDAAVEAGREAVRLLPESAAARNNLGLALLDRAKSTQGIEAAENELRAAVGLDPRYARGYCNLGNALHKLGRAEEAEVVVRKALGLQPRYPQALNLLGVVLGDLDRTDEAIRCFNQALRLAPRNLKPLHNAGQLYLRLGNLEAAQRCFERALDLDHDYVEAAHGLAQSLEKLDRGTEAIEAVRKMARRKPDDPKAQANYGSVAYEQRQYQQAQAGFERALELDPKDVSSLATLDLCQRHLCRWDGFEESVARLCRLTLERVAADLPSPLNPFSAMFFPFSVEQHLAIARAASAGHWKRKQHERERLAFEHPRSRDGKLRLGYLSPDFRNNAVGHLTRGLFALHDRERFEVYGYSIGPDDKSAYRKGIAADCDRFHDLLHASDEAIARRIHADGAHLLIDIAGYTGGGRPEIFALRPAPIQVSWLYPGTMGSSASAAVFDYLVGDSVVTPPEWADHFGETVALLPNSYLIYDHKQSVAERPTSREDAGLPAEGTVFCAFHTRKKLGPGIWDVWMRILERTPGSWLWLIEFEPEGVENLKRETAARGVDPARLLFRGHTPLPEYIALQRHADLFLDVPLYNAHTTANHALFAGLPVLTCTGSVFSSRVATSLVRSAGIPELAAPTIEAYEGLAVELGNDPERLRALRRRLEASRDTCALFDTPRLVRDVEELFLAMWERHERGEAPAAILPPVIPHPLCRRPSSPRSSP